jgi:hypothetical protein
MKIDLSKAYDRVIWLYIKLLLTHFGFEVPFINGVMSCITTSSFTVLIDGLTSTFFHAKKGLRKCFPLSPFLFLLVVEGLSGAMEDANERGEFHGISISLTLNLTHLLFVDDVLLFYNGQRCDAKKFHTILDLFGWATDMQINARKYTLLIHNLDAEEFT